MFWLDRIIIDYISNAILVRMLIQGIWNRKTIYVQDISNLFRYILEEILTS